MSDISIQQNAMQEYKSVVDKFLSIYYLHKDKPNSYNYLSIKWWSGTHIYTIIEYLRLYYTLDYNELIDSWKMSVEFPESEEQLIIYYLVDIILKLNTNIKLRDEFTEYLKDLDDSEQFERFASILTNTTINSLKLNKLLKYEQSQPKYQLSNIISSPEQGLSEFKTAFNTLYGSLSNIYLFSGIRLSLIDNNTLSRFINISKIQYFSIRAWSIDLRVAMHFSSDVRTHENILDNTPFHLIFITKRDKICFVSKTGWESEVVIPSGKYNYKSHFDMIIDGKRFLFVVIYPIDEVEERPMNKSEYKKFLKTLYKNNIASSDNTSDKYQEEIDNYVNGIDSFKEIPESRVMRTTRQTRRTNPYGGKKTKKLNKVKKSKWSKKSRKPKRSKKYKKPRKSKKQKI